MLRAALTPQRCVWQEELNRFSQHHDSWQLSLQPSLLRFHHIGAEDSASQKVLQLLPTLPDEPRYAFAQNDCVRLHSANQGGARPCKLN